MVLAFIVLLTILVVSFISYSLLNRNSTLSYSREIQAQEIALGGIQDILSDFHAEIVAGSIADTAPSRYVVANKQVYIPITNYTEEPARLGYSTASPNLYTNNLANTTVYLPSTLVRVSRASQDGVATDLYPALDTSSLYTNIAAVPGGTIYNRASSANSSNPSANGFSISPSRWNQTYLLAATTLINGAIQIPTAFSTNTPDWVYVTRAGSRACTQAEVRNGSLQPNAQVTHYYGASSPPPASPILGRYAYIVYDEGALLDANVAGCVQASTNSAVMATISYPASASSSVTQTFGGKSYLSYADLSQIPGLSSWNSIDSLVNWRNGSYASSGTISGVNYLQAAFTYAQSGFLSFRAAAGLSDSPLVSRQDLINYFANADPNFNTASATLSQALPYLGTFSRSVNAPSYYPQADAATLGASNNNGINDTGGTIGTGYFAYHANMENAQRSDGTYNPNLDIPNVRFPATIAAGTTITHYADDTTLANYTVNPGDSLVQRRYSLARINWLTHTGPNSNLPNAATAIQACFGLKWGPSPTTYANGGNPCWAYVGPIGSTPQSHIETLAEVAAENPPREPNFFELLKAGILNGSLGLDPGKGIGDKSPPALVAMNAHPSKGVVGSYFNIYEAGADAQVIQIGANIIDQYDTDDYPTAIYFQNIPTTNLSEPEDDLMVNTFYGQENLPYITRINQIELGNSTLNGVSGWLQPELWNPYQANPSTGAPTQFRIQAYGQAYNTLFTVSWQTIPAANPSNISNFSNNTPIGVSSIYFTDSNADTTTSPFYAHPHFLLTSDDPTTQTASLNRWSSSNYPVTTNDGGTGGQPYNPFLAFFCGTTIPYAGPSGAATGKTDWPPGWTYSGALGNYLWDYSIALGAGNYLTAVTEYWDGTKWLPYGSFARDEGTMSLNYAGIQAQSSSIWGSTACQNSITEPSQVIRPDPRTDRFSGAGIAAFSAGEIFWNQSMRGQTMGNYPYYIGLAGCAYAQSPAFTFLPSASPYVQILPFWLANEKTAPSFSPHALDSTQFSGFNAYYSDSDGIVRPGDGYATDGSNASTGDGQMLLDPGQLTSSVPSSVVVRRPVILNHAFRSVGDLGFAFRDEPFKSLDFWTPLSADAGLLDLFSLTDEPAVIAGHVNPNNAPVPVLQSIISGVSKNSDSAGIYLTADAGTLSQAIANQITSSPLRNRADLATSLGATIQTGWGASSDRANKANAEAPVRALAAVADTRTWNLLIDIIAQSGSLTSTAQTLDDFAVSAQKRYWLHIAIDRYTGKIVDQQLEPIYE